KLDDTLVPLRVAVNSPPRVASAVTALLALTGAFKLKFDDTLTVLAASVAVLPAPFKLRVTLLLVVAVVVAVESAALIETAEAATGATANKAAAAALTILKFFFMWSFPP